MKNGYVAGAKAKAFRKMKGKGKGKNAKTPAVSGKATSEGEVVSAKPKSKGARFAAAAKRIK